MTKLRRWIGVIGIGVVLAIQPGCATLKKIIPGIGSSVEDHSGKAIASAYEALGLGYATATELARAKVISVADFEATVNRLDAIGNVVKTADAKFRASRRASGAEAELLRAESDAALRDARTNLDGLTRELDEKKE